MGFHDIPGTTQQYGLISYDSAGSERPEADGLFSAKLFEQAASQAVTNIFFFCHGWKGDLVAAIRQYDAWIGALLASPDVKTAADVFRGFRPLFIGLHWPSLPWGGEDPGSDGSFSAGTAMGQDELLETVVQGLGDSPAIRSQLRTILDQARVDLTPDSLPDNVREAYLRLNEGLGLKSGGVTAPPDADREGFDPEDSYQAALEDAASFGGLTLSGLLAPLGQLSYWMMKKRARSVGEGGMHDFLNAMQQRTAKTSARIHLMGHSFGTVVTSGMLGGPGAGGTLSRPVDSVALIQGAVSLWCYATSIPFPGGGAGYFHGVLSGTSVAGPLITTQSRFDGAVGRLYPLASRLNGSASFAPGFPEYGAVGTYGLQGLAPGRLEEKPMLPATEPYSFKRGMVYNLESSQYICHGGGVAGAHNDIAGPEVAHAIWEAAFASALP